MFKRIIVIFVLLSLFSNSFIYGHFENITGKSAIVMDSDGLSILYNKDAYRKIYPASTTKILTAILVIENLDLDSNITVDKESINSVPYGSSSMYLKVNEILTVRQLLYGLFLPSGNDAAIVLAKAVSGNISNFANLMNEKAKQIGCFNSNFKNPHGFHHDEHYSTAYEMALIMRYASQNETFRKLCETKEYIIDATNVTSLPRKIVSTNMLFDYELDYVLGGKTGYTGQAGNVFVSYATKNGKNLITCLFDGDKNIHNRKTRFVDTKMLLDRSFMNFNKTKILDKNDINILYVDKNTNRSYTLGIKNDIYCLADQNPFSLNYHISYISKNEEIVTGNISIRAGNDNWQFDKIYELEILQTEYYSNFKVINKGWLYPLLIILFIIIISLKSSRTNRKNKNKKIKYIRRKNFK